MKVKDLIEIFQNVERVLGPDAPVCFQLGVSETRQIFDFGESWRGDTYNVCTSIMDVPMNTDPFGMFHFPIREVHQPKFLTTPSRMTFTPEEQKKLNEIKNQLGVLIRKEFTTGDRQDYTEIDKNVPFIEYKKKS